MGSSGRRAAEDEESVAGKLAAEAVAASPPLVGAPIWSGPYDSNENSLGPERTRRQLRLCTCTGTPPRNNFREANVSHKLKLNIIPDEF
jgi:hypothetical protein